MGREDEGEGAVDVGFVCAVGVVVVVVVDCGRGGLAMGFLGRRHCGGEGWMEGGRVGGGGFLRCVPLEEAFQGTKNIAPNPTP